MTEDRESLGVLQGPGTEIAMASEAIPGPVLVINGEHNTGINVSYNGRIGFGVGNIDARQVSSGEFMQGIGYIASDGLMFVPDMEQLYGGCMDSRGNKHTLAGNVVSARPKVIGGPSLNAWYISSIGNFSLIKNTKDPLEQFVAVNKALIEAGFKLGMHVQCGAAMGVVPITERYGENFDDINNLIGVEAQNQLSEDADDISSDILRGVELTGSRAKAASNFTEENMHKIVTELAGPDAVIHLHADPEHENQGHEEYGLVFVRVQNAIVNKDKVVEEVGNKFFYQNAVYAARLVRALARTDEELKRGLIIAEQLPVAGTATLGKGQHVGELSGSLA